MAGLASDDEPITSKTLRMPVSMVREINRFRYRNELPSENEAMRRLLRLALDAQRALDTKLTKRNPAPERTT